MQRIVIANSKGGSGKTTIATHLAACLARLDQQVVLYDHDRQGSSSQWLKCRDPEASTIQGVNVHERRANTTFSWHTRIPPNADYVIHDTPAAIDHEAIRTLVKQSDVILIPVLPSPIDIHSSANFIKDLLLIGKARHFPVQIAVIANRVRKNTLSYASLERFLDTLKIPVVSHIRDTQFYARAAEIGGSVYDLNSPRTRIDRETWKDLLNWLMVDHHEAHGHAQPHHPVRKIEPIRTSLS